MDAVDMPQCGFGYKCGRASCTVTTNYDNGAVPRTTAAISGLSWCTALWMLHMGSCLVDTVAHDRCPTAGFSLHSARFEHGSGKIKPNEVILAE